MRREDAGWTLLLILGLPFLALGLANAGFTASALARASTIRLAWSPVPARIVARQEVPWGRGTRSTVRYAYESGGRRFESSRIDLYDGWPFTIRFLDPDAPPGLQPGSDALAFIDPADPREAVLNPGLRHAGSLLLLSIALAGPGSLCSFGALLALLADRTRRRDAARGLIPPELGPPPGRLLGIAAFWILLAFPLALIAVLNRPVGTGQVLVLALLGLPVLLLVRTWRRARAPWVRFAATRLEFSRFPPGPGSPFRLRLQDPMRRLTAPRFTAAFRHETRIDSDTGPEWAGRDDRTRTLDPVRDGDSWCTELELPASPEPAEAPRERRRWILRAEDGDASAVYAIPLRSPNRRT